MIKYKKIGDLYKVDLKQASKTYLTTYDKCPRCGLENPKNCTDKTGPRVRHHETRLFNKWYLGLFRTTFVTTDAWCDKCGSKWSETRNVKGEWHWHPVPGCIAYWIMMLISLCVAVPTLGWCFHMAGIPVVEREITNGKFACVFIPGLAAVCCVTLSIVRITMKTVHRNRYEKIS